MNDLAIAEPAVTGPSTAETVPAPAVQEVADELGAIEGADFLAEVIDETLPLGDFIREFGQGLLDQVRSQNPPVYLPQRDQLSEAWLARQQILDNLKRKPFKEQSEAVPRQRQAHADMGKGEQRAFGCRWRTC